MIVPNGLGTRMIKLKVKNMNDEQKQKEIAIATVILNSLVSEIAKVCHNAIDVAQENKLRTNTICNIILTALGITVSNHIQQNGVDKKEIIRSFCKTLAKSIGE